MNIVPEAGGAVLPTKHAKGREIGFDHSRCAVVLPKARFAIFVEIRSMLLAEISCSFVCFVGRFFLSVESV
jgi:hypothetical protein